MRRGLENNVSFYFSIIILAAFLLSQLRTGTFTDPKIMLSREFCVIFIQPRSLYRATIIKDVWEGDSRDLNT